MFEFIFTQDESSSAGKLKGVIYIRPMYIRVLNTHDMY